MRRVVALVAFLVFGTAAPAAADVADDWTALLATGTAAHSCPSSGNEAVVDVVVEHGAIVVLDDDGVAVSEHALPGATEPLADRYSVGASASGTLAGRPTSVLTVLEGDLVRVEVVVDPETSMPLVLTSYQADGETHCALVLLDWETSAGVPGDGGPSSDPAQPGPLPEAVQGFRLSDVVVDDAFVAGLYRDGLFTFSLTVWSDDLVVEGTDELGRAELAPGRTLQTWPVDGSTWVMIGDLPSDVRDAVLSELPEPDRGGFLGRLWKRLFG